MYICNECGCMFEDPDVRRTTYESYYGDYSEVSSHTTLYLDICPRCGSDDIEVKEEDEEEEEEDDELCQEGP